MNEDHTLTVVREHLARARDSLGEQYPSIPASKIIARSRMRRGRRWLATAGTAGAAMGLAVALTLSSGVPGQAVHVHTAAWSVDTNSNGTVTVTVHQLTHAAELERALAGAGVPAIVTSPESCLQGTQNRHTNAGVTVSDNPPGLTITPSRLPTGTKLLFSVIPVVVNGTKSTGFGWGLVKNGQPLHCIRVHYPR